VQSDDVLLPHRLEHFVLTKTVGRLVRVVDCNLCDALGFRAVLGLDVAY